MSEFSIGNICKEVQRIQFDLESYGDVVSAIDRCKGLDELLFEIEEGEHTLIVEEEMKIKNRKLNGDELKMSRNERFMVDDAGTLIDMVTGETYDIVEEVVDTLNYYENTCLKYEKTIAELKDGTYKEALPITQRK